jgi:hypothetical protein
LPDDDDDDLVSVFFVFLHLWVFHDMLERLGIVVGCLPCLTHTYVLFFFSILYPQ